VREHKKKREKEKEKKLLIALRARKECAYKIEIMCNVHTHIETHIGRAQGKCKMRIERIGGSRLDTDSEVWGLDQTRWELMWAGEAAMRKSILALRQASYESISDLPRIQKNYRRVIERKLNGDTTGN